MRIVQLHVENVKRIKVATVVPKGPIVAIGGKNAAGKSSLIDSVAYVLGGKALIPEVPIRRGETKAVIDVDLGDLKVTRTFEKKTVKAKDTSGNEVEVEAPLKTELIIRNKEGIKQGTPQEILDKLISKHTFDPLAFFQASDKEKRATLLRVANVDTTLIDAQRAEAFGRRTDVNRRFGLAEARLSGQKRFDDAPEKEIPASEIYAELEKAHAAQRAVDAAQIAVQSSERALEGCKNTILSLEKEITQLEAKLRSLREQLGAANEKRDQQVFTLDADRKNLVDLKAAVPDVQSIRTRIDEVDATNAKVRENVKWVEAKEQRDKLAAEATELTGQIDAFDANKAEILRNARLPIAGLSITDDGVTFNDLPLNQASTAEALQVSAAIGFALNPGLKVLFIKNGNALDDDSRAVLAQVAEENDAQIWMEVVTRNESDREGVSVLMQDGEVA